MVRVICCGLYLTRTLAINPSPATNLNSKMRQDHLLQIVYNIKNRIKMYSYSNCKQ